MTNKKRENDEKNSNGRIITVASGKRGLGGLVKTFINPPISARPSCYWWWFNNLMDKAGITRDLEEAKDKGMGGVMLVCSNPHCGEAGAIPEGPRFLSSEWRELYMFALQEADRLGLEVGVNLCGGWCMGGPWITPENAGRWYLQTELTVTGPQKFSSILPLPGPKAGYDSPPKLGVKKYIDFPLKDVDYRDTTVVAFRDNTKGSRIGEQRGKFLPAKSNRLDGDCFTSVRQVMDQPLAPWSSLPDDNPIAPDSVIDLTAKMQPNGLLEWDVPEGEWTIVRTGHRMTGAEVSVPVRGGEGLEVDWFSKAAVDQHWDNLGKILLADAGKLVGKTLKFFATDSFEDGYPNWTATIREEFKARRGYDMTPYLPALMGRLIGSAEISERFLYDYRKTVADCMADNNYGYLADLAHRHGMEIGCEAAGPSWSATICMDALKNLGRCDRPQGEFWMDLFRETNQNRMGKQTASASHIYGRKTASAEAFTSFLPHWGDSPASMKSIGDVAFCEGINRFVQHTWTATRSQDGLPGYEYAAGTHFNPNVTWWQMGAGPWLSYVGRCQAMLQSGLFVADVLYYNGDGAPNLVEPKHVDPSLGPGYDYDVCNSEVILTRLSVKNGLIVLPDGMSYRMLVLPKRKEMPVEVAAKIAELVKAGATVVGTPPERDPGLKNYPDCDAAVRKIAGDLWGGTDGKSVVENRVGKGRVFEGKSLREILLGDGVTPDIEVSGAKDAFIDFIHRATPEADFYFLANRKALPEKVEVTFRQTGRQPELWNPVSGTQRDLPQFAREDGRTCIPLEFEPDGSMFVVFRKRIQESGVRSQNNTATNFLKFKPVQEIAGPWTVQFDEKWFYPMDGLDGTQKGGTFVFDTLQDWTKRPEDAIKHYSGTATYRKTVRFQSSGHAPLFLDLGVVKEMATVTLNGKNLGVVWCAPWRVDISKAVQEGDNQLEIKVVNLWPNRLIGDAALPVEKRRTRTNIAHKPGAPLIQSGLLGPVRIEAEE